jgi:hypothetical protein
MPKEESLVLLAYNVMHNGFAPAGSSDWSQGLDQSSKEDIEVYLYIPELLCCPWFTYKRLPSLTIEP